MQLITSRGIHPWAALKSQLMRKFSVITFMCIIFAFDPLTHAIELHNSFSIGQKCKWISHFRVSCAFISKRVLVQNHSYENVFDLHENETACRTHFHVKGFALRLVLKQMHKRTRIWPIHNFSQGVGQKKDCVLMDSYSFQSRRHDCNCLTND